MATPHNLGISPPASYILPHRTSSFTAEAIRATAQCSSGVQTTAHISRLTNGTCFTPPTGVPTVERPRKTFSLAAVRDGFSETSGNCYKFGENPEYGPPTAARLIKLIGPDRDIFLKGRRCENQGLGIGAFVYYRRVVENQKNRILGEIVTVAKKLGAATEAIQELEAAKAETQFSKALASVKDSIPQTLLINGHNPLKLLHSALSDGLHDRDDAHCLTLASSIRVVLAELSERLSQALKDEVELNKALSHLLNRKEKAQT